MRQLCFARPAVAEWRDVPEPTIGSATGATVRPLVIGRCDLDVGYMRGLAPITEGAAIGHEMIGEVVDIGSAVLHVKLGDRVIVSAQICCGLCRVCVKGFAGRCETVPFGASFGMGREGGYGCLACDLAYIPFADSMLVPPPAGADPSAMIGAADMALDAWRAVGPMLARRPGGSVLVVGGQASFIGIYAAGLAVALHAGDVLYVDQDAGRLQQAARYGCRSAAFMTSKVSSTSSSKQAGSPPISSPPSTTPHRRRT